MTNSLPDWGWGPGSGFLRVQWQWLEGRWGEVDVVPVSYKQLCLVISREQGLET